MPAIVFFIRGHGPLQHLAAIKYCPGTRMARSCNTGDLFSVCTATMAA